MATLSFFDMGLLTIVFKQFIDTVEKKEQDAIKSCCQKALELQNYVNESIKQIETRFLRVKNVNSTLIAVKFKI